MYIKKIAFLTLPPLIKQCVRKCEESQRVLFQFFNTYQSIGIIYIRLAAVGFTFSDGSGPFESWLGNQLDKLRVTAS